METANDKTWQEDLAEMINEAPEEGRQRLRDFMAGYLAAMQDGQRPEPPRTTED